MKSNELIQSLATDLKPVKALKYGAKEYFVVLLAGLFSILAGLAISGIRSDIQNVMLTPAFITQSLALLMLAVLSTVSAIQMSIPSLEKPIAQKIAASTLIFWSATIVYLLINSDSPFAGWGFSCSREIAINSILPSAAIFFITRHGAVTKRRSVGWLTLTAGAAYGALATQLVCNMSDPLHLLIWHALPVFLIGALGLAFGKFLIKKM